MTSFSQHHYLQIYLFRDHDMADMMNTTITILIMTNNSLIARNNNKHYSHVHFHDH